MASPKLIILFQLQYPSSFSHYSAEFSVSIIFLLPPCIHWLAHELLEEFIFSLVILVLLFSLGIL